MSNLRLEQTNYSNNDFNDSPLTSSSFSNGDGNPPNQSSQPDLPRRDEDEDAGCELDDAREDDVFSPTIAPDRLAAILSVQELKRLYPGRQWRLVHVNVGLQVCAKAP